MDTNYPKAYKEVVEILKKVPKNEADKIPKDLLDMFNNNMDKEYKYDLDITRTFDEQEMLEETKAILANIYRDYWATPEQKARILAIQANELLKIEQIKKQRYNAENILKKEEIQNGEEEQASLALVIQPNSKPKWYKRFIQFIVHWGRY